MAGFAELIVKLGADVSSFQNSMKTVERQVNGVSKNIETTWADTGSNLSSAGADIASSFGVAGAAITAGLGMATKTFMDFEGQMSRVGAIAGANKDQLSELSETAKDLGANTSKSATEVAVGMENLAAMGFETNEIIGAMPGVISAAEASGEDMALVADTMASALNSFNLEADDSTRVADVLAQAANISAAGINDMSYAFKYAATGFNQAGYSIEELSGAVSVLADFGIRGEQAGTGLRSMMGSLASPSKAASKALDQFGITAKDSQGNFLPLIDILEQFEKATADMGSADKADFIKTVFGETGSAIIPLIDNIDKLRENTDKLEQSQGASAKTAKEMKDNLKGAMGELSGAFETLMINMGEALAPAVRAAADALRGLISIFNNLPKGVQKAIVVGIAIVGILLVLIGVIGGVLMFVGAAVAGFTALAPVLGMVGGAFSLLLGPVGLVIAIIAAVIAIGYLLWKNWDSISEGLVNAWKWIEKIASTIWGGITDFFSKWGWEVLAVLTGPIGILVGILAGRFGNIRDKAISVFSDLLSKGKKKFRELKDFIGGIVESIKGFFSGLKLKIPDIKLPKMPSFSLPWSKKSKSSNSSKSTPTYPNWYASGGVFNGASIIGVGEAGPEAVVPLQGRRMAPFADAIASNISGTGGGGGHMSFDPIVVRIEGEGAKNLDEGRIAKAVEDKILRAISHDSRRLPNRYSMSGVR